jgi:hypothetical protein
MGFGVKGKHSHTDELVVETATFCTPETLPHLNGMDSERHC